MDISNEAIEFVEQLSEATTMCLADCLGDLAEDMRAGSPRERALRAAAVIESHARVAQVQILRELHDELEPQVQRLMRGNGTRAAGMAEILAVMARKADELEAGAGQTGERNV